MLGDGVCRNEYPISNQKASRLREIGSSGRPGFSVLAGNSASFLRTIENTKKNNTVVMRVKWVPQSSGL
jgi:hypothetical protein